MTLSFIRTKIFKCLILTACLVTYVSGYAGGDGVETLTASKVFSELPLDVLDMLRPSTRLDMLDYYSQADSILTVQDALGGQSRLEQVSGDYMKVSVTPVSTLEIKILDSGKNPIVMTLYTVGGEGVAKDTDIRFFDSRLRPVEKSKYIKTPSLADFFNLKGSDINRAELDGKIPFMTVEFSTGPGQSPLMATLTSLETTAQEEADVLVPLLREPLSATWNGRFSFR